MDQNSKLFALIKFGSYEHIYSLQKKGQIHMKTVKYFKNLENDIQRKDEYEGIVKLEQINWLKIKIDENTFIETSRENNTLLHGHHLLENKGHEGNLFCLTAITDKLLKQNSKLDSRLVNFGDSMLIIYDKTAFLKRLNSALRLKEFNFEYGFVKYYDINTYNGNLTLLDKSNYFEHQSEWRLHVKTLKDDIFEFEIGNIEDISLLLPSKKIETLRFEIEGLFSD